MKTSELTGMTLDWAVAKCEGKTYIGKGQLNDFKASRLKDRNTYSVSWAQGGPLIAREKMTLSYDEDSQTYSAYVSLFRQRGMSNRTRWRSGSTPLIAAMRCLVASKMGEEVEIPEELLK